MISKAFFHHRKNFIPKVKLSLIKPFFNSCFITSYSLQIKKNLKINPIIEKEINFGEVLNNMLQHTNTIYENFSYNQADTKLDNEQIAKRSKVVKYIKDFIEENLNQKTCTKDRDIILCKIIFFFDLLIIQNKKCKCIISFEKLGLGALILVLKFNKLHEKNWMKKYKSVFNDKYMTLNEINKIEVITLKMLNYDITHPNPLYYIDLLYKNIFSLRNDNDNSFDNIYNQIISIIKYIMTFSNNYIKFHPFFFATFIIKYCFEKNKSEEFHYKFLTIFDTNMRDYKSKYEEFLNTFKIPINIVGILLKQKIEVKQKGEIKPKKNMNKSLIYNKPTQIEKEHNNFASSTFYNGYRLRNGRKKIEKNKRNKSNNEFCSTKLLMNYMNNTYYKKYMDNYFVDNTNNSNKKNYNNISVNEINDNISNLNKNILIFEMNKKNINCSLESPKHCGISINYRLRKKLHNQINENINIKTSEIFNYQKKQEEYEMNKNYKIKRRINTTMDNIQENKKQKEKDNNFNKDEVLKEEENNNQKEKRLNSEITQHRISYYISRGNSIRKLYKSKNKQKNDENNIYIENNNNDKQERIKVNTLNKMKTNQFKLNQNKTIDNNEIKKDSFYHNYVKNKNNNDSNFKSLRSTVNQSESSNILNKENNRDYNTKRVRKMNIRNFYKNKNAILLRSADFEKNEILVN